MALRHAGNFIAWDQNYVVYILANEHSHFVPSTGATAFRTAFFGQGTGDILLDNLGCSGTEQRLVDCPNNGIGIHNCVHAEDAGLRCAGM